ncbi:MAG TPA: peptide ABC transporter substrate-binding protein [Pyrinomonadaceae bacterium]|nr:peptide ABC transporter substrate-binding protein [Pyrinomonadaceae bacterium]
MSFFHSSQFRLSLVLLVLALIAVGCSAAAKNSIYFGKTDPPAENILRYVSGSETESLDPQVGTSQPDARIYMALYEGLTEYHPKTMEPIPGVAERWEVNRDSSEFIFYLRRNARWSNGDPITAQDFLYTFRRGLNPQLASRNAYLAYYIKYGQAYNEGGVFARDPQKGDFVLVRDVRPDAGKEEAPLPPGATPTRTNPSSPELPATGENPELDTPFHRLMHLPERLVLPGDEADREKLIAGNARIKEAVAGKEFVPVRAEDIGVEAIDDYTFRVTLSQPAPFFIGLVPHQFFRVVHRQSIEKHGERWTQPGHIVNSGPFKLKAWRPYHQIVVERNPYYWDAAIVKLDEIYFYPLQDYTTIMNLYKAGEVDATQNHSVPKSWLDIIMPLQDYMDAPEVAIEYYQFQVTKPPMNDRRVRKAFNMAVDKKALAEWRKIVKPLTAFTPEGIFPGYPQPKGDPFDPEKAKKLLAEAGYRDGAGNYDPKKFPLDQVELSYNPDGGNRQVAEYMQAQWKQNLGLTIPLKSMEFRTFLNARAKGDYKGIARNGWVGDYMDPFTFLNLFTKGAENGTLWEDPKYDAMLEEANRMLDPAKRYELMAKAEAYLLESQPIVPLYTNATNWVKKPYVKGMYPNPGTLLPWKFVYIERDPSKWDRGLPTLAELGDLAGK